MTQLMPEFMEVRAISLAKREERKGKRWWNFAQTPALRLQRQPIVFTSCAQIEKMQ
jgi:hypothetical protein